MPATARNSASSTASRLGTAATCAAFRCVCPAAGFAAASAVAAALSVCLAAAAAVAETLAVLRCAAAAAAWLLFLASAARLAARARTTAITASLVAWHPEEVLTGPVLVPVTLLASDSPRKKKRTVHVLPRVGHFRDTLSGIGGADGKPDVIEDGKAYGEHARALEPTLDVRRGERGRVGRRNELARREDGELGARVSGVFAA